MVSVMIHDFNPFQKSNIKKKMRVFSVIACGIKFSSSVLKILCFNNIFLEQQ